MNFWDLCVVCAHAIGRACAACGRLLAHMLRLTYRYWWIVLTIVALAVAAALYYTRPDNITYKINAVALLNGPTIQQFEKAFAPVQAMMENPEAPIYTYSVKKKATGFAMYRVVDCQKDGVADYIDFARKSSPTDTVKVQMQDRVCLQFRMKTRYLELLPEVEKALMAYLNSNEAMQQAYAAYLPNLQEEVAFNHRQAAKLDSLTSAYYFGNVASSNPVQTDGNGMHFYGDRRVHLFLNDIYKQQQHLRMGDYRLQLATTPVTLENHFVVDPKPVNGRKQNVLLFFLLGWIGGCLLAEVIDKRKAIIAWLKQ